MLHTVIALMRPVKVDREGFRTLCERGEIAWLKVWYIHKLAKKGGPFPRRQDLDPTGFVVGYTAGRKFVMTYAWATEYHPSPDGKKMKELSVALKEHGAKDKDVVFVDYCSLYQAQRGVPAIYFENCKVASPQKQRTPGQDSCFMCALQEMSRIFSFVECEILVLPSCNMDENAWTSWGMVNTRPYELRGWPCSEFAIARANDRIINMKDPQVQHIENFREWPTDPEA